ncbi:MAG: hypothetical protein JW726_00925 [Anaerolineales bacterium]|nr:hypothetical protein [Anaerolineales bacterium]
MNQDPQLQRVETEEDEPEIEIDLEALAREVYELLKEELWIEKDRQGWRRLW